MQWQEHGKSQKSILSMAPLFMTYLTWGGSRPKMKQVFPALKEGIHHKCIFPPNYLFLTPIKATLLFSPPKQLYNINQWGQKFNLVPHLFITQQMFQHGLRKKSSVSDTKLHGSMRQTDPCPHAAQSSIRYQNKSSALICLLQKVHTSDVKV